MEPEASVVSSIFANNANGSSNNRVKIEVPSISPNTLIKNYIDESHIDLMKIDIEGAEYMFFDTISDTNLKKVKKIIIEFHNNDNYEVMKILRKLAKNNFTFKLFNWGSFTNEYIIENKMGVIYAYQQ
jgi:hypothetical protein